MSTMGDDGMVPFKVVIKELSLPEDFHTWTEVQWLAVENYVKEQHRLKEEKGLPQCKRCGGFPSESNGFEERFCPCGMVHVVTKRVGRKDENQAAKEFKKSQ